MSFPRVPADHIAKVFTSATEPFSYTPGLKYVEPATGCMYRFYKNAGADATVIGDLVGDFGTTPNHGDGDVTAATVTSGSAIGIAQSALTTGQYGFAQTDGPNQSVITTDGSITAGCVMIPDATAAVVKIQSATSAANDFTVGWATTADSSTSLAVGDARLCIP